VLIFPTRIPVPSESGTLVASRVVADKFGQSLLTDLLGSVHSAPTSVSTEAVPSFFFFFFFWIIILYRDRIYYMYCAL
jgi:hypothetical protein